MGPIRCLARLVARTLTALLALIVVYGVVAFGLGQVTVNENFRPTSGGWPVGVIDNGAHVDIVLPLAGGGVDWAAVLPAGAIPARAKWIGFGWGAREFYMETPTWAYIDPVTAIRSLAGLGGVVVRTHFRDALFASASTRIVMVSRDQYMALAQAIRAEIVTGPDGRAAAMRSPAYDPTSLFLPAKGRYSPVLTCNEWASRKLAAAGIATRLWSPFPWTVLD